MILFTEGEATNMIQEFEEYGLNESVVYIVGFFKVSAALFLLLGIYYNKLIFPSALTISLFMIGAVIMHFKVSDELIKYMPSSILLFSSLVMIYLDRFIKT